MPDNIIRAERKEREAANLIREAKYLRDLQRRLDEAEIEKLNDKKNMHR